MDVMFEGKHCKINFVSNDYVVVRMPAPDGLAKQRYSNSGRNPSLVVVPPFQQDRIEIINPPPEGGG